MTRSDRMAAIIAAHFAREGPLLPILRDVQAEFGCIDEDAEAAIARALNLSRADVHGVVSFYHDFSSLSDNRPEMHICRAEACKARGVDDLMPAAMQAAGDRVRLKTVYCLGLCSVGPNARIGDDLYARLDAGRIAELVESI